MTKEINAVNMMDDQGTFLLLQTDAYNYKIIGILKQLKFLPPPCTAHLHYRLVCGHDIDHVSNDEHIESYLQF